MFLQNVLTKVYLKRYVEKLYLVPNNTFEIKNIAVSTH